MAATPPHSPDEVENTSVSNPFQLSPRGDDSSGSGVNNGSGGSGSVGVSGASGNSASGASGGSSAGSNAPVLYRQFSTDSDITATATTTTNNKNNNSNTSANTNPNHNTNTNTNVTTTTTTTKTRTNRLEIIEQVRTIFCIDCTQHIVLKRANTYLYSEIFPCDVLNR